MAVRLPLRTKLVAAAILAFLPVMGLAAWQSAGAAARIERQSTDIREQAVRLAAVRLGEMVEGSRRMLLTACTHAAAIAQVDKDQLFYLESRGLNEEASRSLVVEGFLQSLVERLGQGPVREEIAERLETRLAEIL